MKGLIDHYLERFKVALTLSAQRGGFKSDLAGLYARLTMFQRKENMEFNEWFAITQEAGQTFIEWVNWYQRD